MALWQNLVEITDITALKAFTPAVDGDKRLVKTVSTIIPTSPSWYRYDASATYSELLPAIVSPNNGTGRWIMLNPIAISFNAPLADPPFAQIRWVKVDDESEWLSKQIDNSLEWISTSAQSEKTFNLTSAVVTTNGTITQGCNSLEFLCLSGNATVGNIPLDASPTSKLKGFKFPSLDNNEIYSSINYSVSGQLLIVQSRPAIASTSPVLVTVNSSLITNASGSTPTNSKWLSALLLSGTATLDNIPLDPDGINGYEFNYQKGKLYGAIGYSVPLNSELILVSAL